MAGILFWPHSSAEFEHDYFTFADVSVANKYIFLASCRKDFLLYLLFNTILLYWCLVSFASTNIKRALVGLTSRYSERSFSHSSNACPVFIWVARLGLKNNMQILDSFELN